MLLRWSNGVGGCVAVVCPLGWVGDGQGVLQHASARGGQDAGEASTCAGHGYPRAGTRACARAVARAARGTRCKARADEGL